MRGSPEGGCLYHEEEGQGQTMDKGPLCASLVPAAGQRKEVETSSAAEEGDGRAAGARAWAPGLLGLPAQQQPPLLALVPRAGVEVRGWHGLREPAPSSRAVAAASLPVT